MSDGIIKKTATELGRMMAAGQVSALDIMRTCLDRTKEVDEAVGAFISFDEQDALDQATASDNRRRSGESFGALDGIPVAIKDVLSVRGQPLGCASSMLAGFVSPYDAHVIELYHYGSC